MRRKFSIVFMILFASFGCHHGLPITAPPSPDLGAPPDLSGPPSPDMAQVVFPGPICNLPPGSPMLAGIFDDKLELIGSDGSRQTLFTFGSSIPNPPGKLTDTGPLWLEVKGRFISAATTSNFSSEGGNIVQTVVQAVLADTDGQVHWSRVIGGYAHSLSEGGTVFMQDTAHPILVDATGGEHTPSVPDSIILAGVFTSSGWAATSAGISEDGSSAKWDWISPDGKTSIAGALPIGGATGDWLINQHYIFSNDTLVYLSMTDNNLVLVMEQPGSPVVQTLPSATLELVDASEGWVLLGAPDGQLYRTQLGKLQSESIALPPGKKMGQVPPSLGTDGRVLAGLLDDSGIALYQTSDGKAWSLVGAAEPKPQNSVGLYLGAAERAGTYVINFSSQDPMLFAPTPFPLQVVHNSVVQILSSPLWEGVTRDQLSHDGLCVLFGSAAQVYEVETQMMHDLREKTLRASLTAWVGQN